MRRGAWTLLFCVACLSGSGALSALDFVGVDGSAFAAGGRRLAVRGMDVADAGQALAALASAGEGGINLVHVRLDSLPSSATPGIPSEAGWRTLDEILDQASKAEVYALPSLANFKPGGGAGRFSARLGGQGSGLYLADGRARAWYLYLVQLAGGRRNSVNGRLYRDDPTLFGWSLAADLGDADDPAGERAGNWAQAGAEAMKRVDPRHLVGLDFALPVPPAFGKAAALDFLVLPASAVDAANAALGRPLLSVDGQGRWSSIPDGRALRLGGALLRLTGPHEAEIAVRTSEPAVVSVDYGDDGRLKSSASAPQGTLARIWLKGLRSGAGYQLRLRALGPGGRVAASPLLSLAVPGEARLPARPADYSGNIIRVADGEFMDGNRPFRYIGANNYSVRFEDNPEHLAQVLDTARDMGMRVLRCQANGELFEPIQPGIFQPLRWMVDGSPEGYHEAAFAAYDRLMAECAKRGLRVIVYVTDNWEYFGGMKTWVRWRGLDNKNAFYTDSRVQADFKALIRHWATRVNTVTGLRYADDPALFSWELANEPRDEDDPSSHTVAAWADAMAATFKGIDPKHMVSCGFEGIHASGGTTYSGADFVVAQQSKNLDFATFHFYPVSDDRRYSLRAAKQALRDYVALGHGTLHKPVVMEEFGIGKKYDGDLNRYEWVQTLAESFMKAGGDGENYWMLVDDHYDAGDGNEFQPKDVDYCNLFNRLAYAVNTGVRP